MKIKIDNTRYHCNELSETEINKGKNIYKQLITRYPTLVNTINGFFTKYKYKYTDKEQEMMIRNVIISIVKELNDDNKELDDNNFYSYIKHTLCKVLPVILENEKSIAINKYYLYEPNMAYSLNILNSFSKDIRKYELDGKLNLKSDEGVILYQTNNIVRALKSSLIMFATGDDVHGASILRGAIELMARMLSINDENINKYREYILLNAELQYYKQNNELTDHLKQFLDTHKERGAKLESLLLNGWCLSKNNKPILSNTDIIKHSLGDYYATLYSRYSEFVHEDYLVGYDFVTMRIQCKNLIKQLVIFVKVIYVHCDFKLSEKSLNLVKYIEKSINQK